MPITEYAVMMKSEYSYAGFFTDGTSFTYDAEDITAGSTYEF